MQHNDLPAKHSMDSRIRKFTTMRRFNLLYRVHNMMAQRKDIGGLLERQNRAVWLVQNKENFREQEPNLQLQQPRSLRPWLRCERAN